VERGGREVDQELRAGEGQVGRGRPGLPDVLADGRPDVDIAEASEDELAALREVAMLVEDAVVGQELLPVDCFDLSRCTDRARVREITVEPGGADECDDAGRGARDLLERLTGRAQKPGTEKEILGRVARDRELRENGEVGACGARVRERSEDLLAVPGEVADDDVDLREREPQSFRLSVTNLV